uniref:Uncharacterized protein n=1 Tax=Setaria italica TaxID=4555 RepID=K3ZFV7_SETIT
MVFSSLPIFLDPPNWGQVIDLPYCSSSLLLLVLNFSSPYF